MLRCRFIQESGTIAWLRIYWGGTDTSSVCPNCGGKGNPGYHNARVPLAQTDELEDWKLGGRVEDYPDERWPTQCDHCDEPVPVGKLGLDLPHGERVYRQVFRKRRYNTDSGSPEPGDMFWSTWRHAKTKEGYIPSCEWDNCDGKHLIVVLPNGFEWDVDSRASNCTMPNDRKHRCWVRSGTPPKVNVDKKGLTCKAGAGSIAAAGYHGFLRHGVLT